jgi:hypothetical protein
MQGSLAFDPFRNQSIPDAVSQSHETGILIRRLRISAQSKFDMAKYIVFQGNRRCGDGARSSGGFDLIASSYRVLNPEKSLRTD